MQGFLIELGRRGRATIGTIRAALDTLYKLAYENRLSLVFLLFMVVFPVVFGF